MGVSWATALIGAASATATAAIIAGKPKDPTFQVLSINLSSFHLKFPFILDIELILTVHITNPNIVPIEYSTTTMSIFYDGSLLGTTQILPGSQPPKSSQVLQLPARLSGVELAHHGARLFADVARREMVLDASVDIAGTAKVLWWVHKFKIHVDSRITVDPVYLDVIEQENKPQLELFVA